MKGHIDVVDFLISVGANVNSEEIHGELDLMVEVIVLLPIRFDGNIRSTCFCRVYTSM